MISGPIPFDLRLGVRFIRSQIADQAVKRQAELIGHRLAGHRQAKAFVVLLLGVRVLADQEAGRLDYHGGPGERGGVAAFRKRSPGQPWVDRSPAPISPNLPGDRERKP